MSGSKKLQRQAEKTGIQILGVIRVRAVKIHPDGVDEFSGE